MDDAAVMREQAAETLRSVEGMRRRTAAAGQRATVFPLLAYAAVGLVTAVWGLIQRTPSCVYRHIGPGSDEGSCSNFPNLKVTMAVAIAVALIIAFIATEVHYRRLPVHPASPKQQISIPQAILLAALVIVGGPFVIGALFSATFLFFEGGALFIFLLVSIAAVVQARHIRNDALGRAGALAALSLITPGIMSNDFEAAIVGFLYAAAFLIAAAIVHRRRANVA